MALVDPVLKDAIAARVDGRYDEALDLLLSLFRQAGRKHSPGQPASHFITMFEWEQLAEIYPPARDALARARDDQVRRLLGGDANFDEGGERLPRFRFDVIADMNETLKDARATYDLFVQLEVLLPALARRHAWRALQAIVDAGDFRLAERYLPKPLGELTHLNRLAGEFPLLPPNGTAPRLAAELSNFVKDLRLHTVTLCGLGRETEAEATRNTALAGIASDELRALAQRELAEPGTINGMTADHRMAFESARRPA